MVLYDCKFIIRLIYVNMGMTIIVKYGELFDIYIYMYIYIYVELIWVNHNISLTWDQATPLAAQPYPRSCGITESEVLVLA